MGDAAILCHGLDQTWVTDRLVPETRRYGDTMPTNLNAENATIDKKSKRLALNVFTVGKNIKVCTDDIKPYISEGVLEISQNQFFPDWQTVEVHWFQQAFGDCCHSQFYRRKLQLIIIECRFYKFDTGYLPAIFGTERVQLTHLYLCIDHSRAFHQQRWRFYNYPGIRRHRLVIYASIFEVSDGRENILPVSTGSEKRLQFLGGFMSIFL